MDPDNLKDGAHDDDAVKPVEGGRKVGGEAKRIHANAHFEDEHAQETELSINWNQITIRIFKKKSIKIFI